MDGWIKIIGAVVTVTAATVMAIAAYYESQRRQNEGQYAYGHENRNREHININEFRATNSQRQSSQDSAIERKKAEKLAKLRAERQKQLEEAEKKRKEEEDERKRKREKEEKERKRNEKMKSMLDSFDDAFDSEIGVKTEKESIDENIDDWSGNTEKQKLKEEFRAKEDERKRKREKEEKERKRNEKMKSMLDSFDDAFDIEIGVKTEKESIDENIDDWSRNTEKQKLKEEFRAKQMTQQQKIQDEKEKMKDNNRTDDLKIEQQKPTIKKRVIDKKFKVKELLLNTIINLNIENNFTVAISLKSIKKNKRKKVTDLEKLQSAVLSFKEISQENESSKMGAIPKKFKNKVKKQKAGKQTGAQQNQENKLENKKNFQNCRSIFVQKQLEDQKRKLEMEKKKREEVIVEWKLRRQLRQQYHKLARPKSKKTKLIEDDSNIIPLQKQLENLKRTVNLEESRREEAERLKDKLNFYDNEIIYGDSYNFIRLNQLSELMSQTKSKFAHCKKTEDGKEQIHKQMPSDKLKRVKEKSKTSKPICNKKFKCPNFVLYAIININTTNQDTVAASLRSIEKNKKKKAIDLQELDCAVLDLQEISSENDPLQDHALPVKVKKPKTQEQIAARKLRKQLRKQKGTMQYCNVFDKREIKIAVCE